MAYSGRGWKTIPKCESSASCLRSFSAIEKLRALRNGEVVIPDPAPITDQDLLDVAEELQEAIDHIGDLCGRLANLPAPDVTKQWVDFRIDLVRLQIRDRDIMCVALGAATAAVVTVLFNLL